MTAPGFGDTYIRYNAAGLADLVRRSNVTLLELLKAAGNRLDAVDGEFWAIVRAHIDLAKASLKGRADSGVFRGAHFLLTDFLTDLQGRSPKAVLGSHVAKPDDRHFGLAPAYRNAIKAPL